uniref:RRM domain-containing protein n=1 Tax=Oryza punctata TaxID=4537 RepID=A0A0E0K8M4_ORYPU
MALPTLSKIFVGGIGPYTGDEDHRRHFQNVHMPIDQHTGRHHGFAFIQFTCLEGSNTSSMHSPIATPSTAIWWAPD